jgi:hypothetical protein
MNDTMFTNQQAQLDALTQKATIDQVLAFFDSLAAVPIASMLGSWRGSGLETDHPLDGMLESFYWYGKRFRSTEDVDPLVFTKKDGSLFAINPAMVPLGIVNNPPGIASTDAAGLLFKIGSTVLQTNEPAARLRMTEYRGVSSATMIYDRLPINDVFRMVTPDVLIGAMDIRGNDQPFMFVLKRDAITPVN